MCGRKTKSLLFLSLNLALSTSGLAATFEVTNLNDADTGSLRDAVTRANATPGPDNVTFAAGVSGTITLQSALPFVTDSISVFGPGRELLEISGNNQFSGFRRAPGGFSALDISLSGLTLTEMTIGGMDPGAAIFFDVGSLTLQDIALVNNGSLVGDLSILAGGVHGTAIQIDIDNLIAVGNRSSEAALVISTGSEVDITNTLIASNQSIYFAALYCNGSAVSVSGLEVRDNESQEQSTASIHGQSVTLSDIWFTDNTVAGGLSAQSAALEISAITLLIDGGVFAGNSANVVSGAEASALKTWAFDQVLRNLTISGNSGARSGLHVEVRDANTARLEYISLLDNASETGGLIVSSGGQPSLTGQMLIAASVLANNSGMSGPADLDNADFDGALLVDRSLLQVPVTPYTEPNPGTNLIGIDPLLGPLADNGGNTLTQVPMPASPLIDHIDSASPTCSAFPLDQRGFTRPAGAGCDIGAAERQPPLFSDSLEDLP